RVARGLLAATGRELSGAELFDGVVRAVAGQIWHRRAARAARDEGLDRAASRGARAGEGHLPSDAPRRDRGIGPLRLQRQEQLPRAKQLARLLDGGARDRRDLDVGRPALPAVQELE